MTSESIQSADLITVDQMCEIVDLSRPTARVLILEHCVRSIRIGGRTFVSRLDCERLGRERAAGKAKKAAQAAQAAQAAVTEQPA